jgi:uncharacterized protein (DUF1499 family)
VAPVHLPKNFISTCKSLLTRYIDRLPEVYFKTDLIRLRSAKNVGESKEKKKLINFAM